MAESTGSCTFMNLMLNFGNYGIKKGKNYNFRGRGMGIKLVKIGREENCYSNLNSDRRKYCWKEQEHSKRNGLI